MQILQVGFLSVMDLAGFQYESAGMRLKLCNYLAPLDALFVAEANV